ncbi:MAG: hypothetical protein JST83_12355 [Bacteroidetes bacterium]|nr:hypothetical protein [Bacteroidota bacterium]
MIDILPGTWHLHYSTFPMWQRKGMHSVTFNYGIIDHQGTAALLDEVRYQKHDRYKCITGYDYPDHNDHHGFIWRGKGFLSLFKSKWRVEWMSEDQMAMVISFEKTLITPAGIDILTKDGADASQLLIAREIGGQRGLLKGINDPLLPVSI